MEGSAGADLLALLAPGAPGRLTDPAAGWPAVLALADEHQLLPAVWAALRRRGVAPVPASARADSGLDRSPLVALEAAYLDNRTHSEGLARVLDQALAVLADAGIDVVPLKGSHWLLAGWLPDPAARTTIDVDLLIELSSAPSAEHALRAAGFTPLATTADEWADHQRPALLAPSGAASVELHVAPLISFHAAVITSEEILATAAPPEAGAPSLPTPTDAVTLLVAHGQLQDFNHRYRRLPLRALIDLVSIRDAGALDDVDWDRVQACFCRAGQHQALAGFAVAARELMGVDLPVASHGGDRWLAEARRGLDSPRRARWHTRRAAVGLALSARRMDRLYATTGPRSRTWARLRHLATAPARRRTRPPELPPG